MEREIKLADLDLAKVQDNPALITETMEKGYVPQISTTHDQANTVSCLVGEHLMSKDRRFHEVYASSQDTPENLARKLCDVKEEETIILVRHENEYTPATMNAVWDAMFKYKDRLVVIILKRKGKG